MNALIIALIVAVSSTVSPLLLAYLTGKQRQQERREEWARQDLLETRMKQNASSLKEANGKLDTIHALVNSELTARMQSELEALKHELSTYKRIDELNRMAGNPTNVSHIRELERRIEVLADHIEERLRVQHELEEKVKKNQRDEA